MLIIVWKCSSRYKWIYHLQPYKIKGPISQLVGFLSPWSCPFVPPTAPLLISTPISVWGTPNLQVTWFLCSKPHQSLSRLITKGYFLQFSPSLFTLFQTKTDVEHAPFANDVPRESMGFPHFLCVHPRGFYAAILGSTVHGGFFTCEVHCQRTQFSSNTLQLGENTWLQWCPCSVLFHGEFLQRMSTLDQ